MKSRIFKTPLKNSLTSRKSSIRIHHMNNISNISPQHEININTTIPSKELTNGLVYLTERKCNFSVLKRPILEETSDNKLDLSLPWIFPKEKYKPRHKVSFPLRRTECKLRGK